MHDMWEFLVKKTFPRRPVNQGSDIQAAHAVTNSHSVKKVDGDEKHTAEASSIIPADQKKRTLICPVCSVVMEVRTIGSLQIDQCPRCEGIFLDRGELQILSGVDDSFFQTESHKYLIYTPHGLSDSIKSEDKKDIRE